MRLPDEVPRVAPGHLLSCNGLSQCFYIAVFIAEAPLYGTVWHRVAPYGTVWHRGGALAEMSKLFSLNRKTVSTQPITDRARVPQPTR